VKNEKTYDESGFVLLIRLGLWGLAPAGIWLVIDTLICGEPGWTFVDFMGRAFCFITGAVIVFLMINVLGKDK
jgi:hypothetical protein